jgi:hypothetical protein
MEDKLLSREEFKKQVFAKTKGKCCISGCNCDAVDAHHIMDRKLWSDGGYYLSNGAALCAKHHLDAEQGRITPAECIDSMRIEPLSIRKPDKITALDYDEYFCLMYIQNSLNKWGE